MLAAATTFALEGVEGRRVSVEVDVRRGLPAFTVVGLPDAAIRESRERVRAALLNSGLEFPLQRVTANLAPADLRKSGPAFDLAIAVALLAASGQVPADELSTLAVCGELSLGGAVRPVRGAVAVADAARRAGFDRLAIAAEIAGEAALVEGIAVLPVPTLRSFVELLRGGLAIEPARPVGVGRQPVPSSPDLADVRGQDDAKRALEIAAAGGHSLLLVGPPGAGKTMLARRLPGILPPPTFEEAVEITRIHGVAGLGTGGLVRERPFRAPHHSISASGLVGGGAVPRPGEITLAHRGVLFLDELGEFSRSALESLRAPLEAGRAVVTRGQHTVEFPARVVLVAASNPCPCGRGGPACTCDLTAQRRYRARLSGPLLDRIDLVCELGPASPVALAGSEPPRSASAAVRERVLAARRRQSARFAHAPATTNADMDPRTTRAVVALGGEAADRLREGHLRLGLSARGRDRVLRIARTIADLDGRAAVEATDIAEALGYRMTIGEEVAA